MWAAALFWASPPNNGMHPTARSVPLINFASCDAGCRFRRAAGDAERYAASHIVAGRMDVS
jgi:hypothetical protein